MNRKRLIMVVCIFTTCLLLSAQKRYQRVISLVPSITQNIYYLKAESRLVGCTSYCTPAIADKKEVVATAIEANVEKIVLLKPDVVIVSTLTSPKDIATMRKFGIEVVEFASAKSFEEICSQYITLGKMLEKQTEAEKTIDECKAKIKKLSKTLRWNVVPKIFFQIGADPIFAVLDNTFMGEYISMLGGKNIASKLAHGIVSREFVISQAPDFIFITSMGISSEEEAKTWKRYTTLPAVKNNRIFIVDANKACQPTPITFIETLEEMTKMCKQRR